MESAINVWAILSMISSGFVLFMFSYLLIFGPLLIKETNLLLLWIEFFVSLSLFAINLYLMLYILIKDTRIKLIAWGWICYGGSCSIFSLLFLFCCSLNLTHNLEKKAWLSFGDKVVIRPNLSEVKGFAVIWNFSEDIGKHDMPPLFIIVLQKTAL